IGFRAVPGVIDNEEIVGMELLQLLGEGRIDPRLGGLFVLQIDDLRIRNAAFLEKIYECVVTPVLDRERAVGLRMFPAQNADGEDPGLLRFPAEVFAGSESREEERDEEQSEYDTRRRKLHLMTNLNC